MDVMDNIDVLFIAGFGPIVRDFGAAKRLYKDILGLPLEGEDYLNSNQVDGVKEFALWPLSEAAESCFSTNEWPNDLPVPQAWLEFDVADIEAATKELEAQGYRLLVSTRKEPWGQTVTRFLSPEGILLGISHTPWLRGEGERP
jgi:catechol 2,3-dioxygenase-like lactoylglutathione lyase family enzyme